MSSHLQTPPLPFGRVNLSEVVPYLDIIPLEISKIQDFGGRGFHYLDLFVELLKRPYVP